jgi:hypothetical protein
MKYLIASLFLTMLCINNSNLFANNGWNLTDSLQKSNESAANKTTVLKKNKSFSPIPKYAIMRSAIMPGWGQFYNRKYWKVPLVYVSAATACYFIAINYSGYQNVRNGIAKRLDDNLLNDDDPILVGDYDFKKYDVGFNTTPDLFKIKAYFRKNLDLAIIGFAVVHVLNIIDADVDAHLYNFNMSNDLSLQPIVNGNGIGIALKWK